MRPSKKPKYQLDVKKYETQHEQTKKKESDWAQEEIFNEALKSKLRHKHR